MTDMQAHIEVRFDSESSDESNLVGIIEKTIWDAFGNLITNEVVYDVSHVDVDVEPWDTGE